MKAISRASIGWPTEQDSLDSAPRGDRTVSQNRDTEHSTEILVKRNSLFVPRSLGDSQSTRPSTQPILCPHLALPQDPAADFPILHLGLAFGCPLSLDENLDLNTLAMEALERGRQRPGGLELCKHWC